MADGDSHEAYDRIVDASRALASEYVRDPAWSPSPFAWIQDVSSASRGRVGRDFVREWARESGFSISHENDHGQIYLLIDGWRVQVKMSLLWRSGFYKFQQIRDQDYDFCFCIGISPNEVHAWLVPKDVLDIEVIGQQGQHMGVLARDTFWFTAVPGSEPLWLSPWGRHLADATRIMTDFSGSR